TSLHPWLSSASSWCSSTGALLPWRSALNASCVPVALAKILLPRCQNNQIKALIPKTMPTSIGALLDIRKLPTRRSRNFYYLRCPQLLAALIQSAACEIEGHSSVKATSSKYTNDPA